MRTAGGDDVEVMLYTPDNRTIIGPDLSSRLRSCSFTTARPGGFYGASFSIDPVPGHFWRPFSHCVVTINGVTAWEGRANPPRMSGRWITGFGASGYGFSALEDEPYFSTDATLVTVDSILRNAVTEAAAAINFPTGNSSDAPVGSRAALDFDRMYVSAILEQIVSGGTGDGKPIDWFIWENRTLSLKNGGRPSIATYHVSIDDDGMTREPRDGELSGRVKVSYTDATTGVAAITGWSPDIGFIGLYNVDKRIVIEGGKLSLAAAEAIRDTQAGIVGTRRFATTIQRANGYGLPGPHGSSIVPFWLTRADGWVRIPDADTDEWLPIVGTSVDLFAGTLQVTCGEQRDDFLMVWRNTQRENRRSRQRRNRLTGAREGL